MRQKNAKYVNQQKKKTASRIAETSKVASEVKWQPVGALRDQEGGDRRDVCASLKNQKGRS